MSKKRVYSHILLDRSGSMQNGYEKTVEAVNGYIGQLKNDPDISSRVSVSLFDSTSLMYMGTAPHSGHPAGLALDHLFENVKPKDAPAITSLNYQPRGSTPLLDAIGHTIALIDKQTRREGEIVSLVIVTDGMENASVEHTKDSIKRMLDARKTAGWLVIYLGADHDAFAQAGSIGVAGVNTMNYGKLNSENATQAVFRGVKDYAVTGVAASAAFTTEERMKAAK